MDAAFQAVRRSKLAAARRPPGSLLAELEEKVRKEKGRPR